MSNAISLKNYYKFDSKDPISITPSKIRDISSSLSNKSYTSTTQYRKTCIEFQKTEDKLNDEKLEDVMKRIYSNSPVWNKPKEMIPKRFTYKSIIINKPILAKTNMKQILDSLTLQASPVRLKTRSISHKPRPSIKLGLLKPLRSQRG